MRLTVLGGSAAGPNPGQGCSGYLVESGPTRVVLDLGPGTLPELRRHVNFREVDGVILSHLHLDHMLDILAMRFALAYNPVAPRAPVPLWMPPGGMLLLEGLAGVLAEPDQAESYFSVYDVREYDPLSTLIVGELTIRFTPTRHFVPCWAMRVSDGVSGDLFYSADSGPDRRLASFAAGASVVVAEGTMPAEPDVPVMDRGHMTPAEAGRLARDAGAKVLVLSHLWAENDILLALQCAEAAFGGQTALATPGLRITWRPGAIEAR